MRAGVLVVLASVLLMLSVLATWTRAQIIDTDGWTQTSVRLLQDEQVRGAVSRALSERLLSVVDPRKLAAKALPSELSPLAGALSSTAAELVPQTIDRALQSPLVQELWARANRTAHTQVIELLDGGGSALKVSGGVVSVDLGELLDRLAKRLGIPGDPARRLSPERRRIVLLRSKQVHLAQASVRALRDLSVALPIATLLCFLGALALAAGARRRALLEIGVGVIVAALSSLLLREYADSYLVTNVIAGQGARPTARAVLSILTEGWRDRALWLLLVGALILLGGAALRPAARAGQSSR